MMQQKYAHRPTTMSVVVFVASNQFDIPLVRRETTVGGSILAITNVGILGGLMSPIAQEQSKLLVN